MTAVFIDRDGTMGGGYDMEFPWMYAPYPGTREAFALLNSNGFFPIIFTNQSCIARGKDNGYDFAAEFREIGAYDWFICPHDAGDGCNCRKPKTGLLEQAQAKYGLDLSSCFVIGDRWSDMLAGGLCGCRLILVMTGRGQESLGIDRARWGGYSPDWVAPDILDAARWICRHKDNNTKPA